MRSLCVSLLDWRANRTRRYKKATRVAIDRPWAEADPRDGVKKSDGQRHTSAFFEVSEPERLRASIANGVSLSDFSSTREEAEQGIDRSTNGSSKTLCITGIKPWESPELVRTSANK